MSDPDPRRARRAFVAAALLLALYNLVRSLVGFGAWQPLGVVVLLALLGVLAWLGGLTFADLGLARDRWRAGLRDGLIVVGLVVAVVAIAAALPATRGAFDDSRAELSGARLAARVFGGILFVTVIPEEFAFRGVLLGSGTRGWSARVGLIASSVLFGLWHVLPTWNDTARRTALQASGGQRVLVVLGTVAVTALAGVGFAWLRRRSGSLAAPVLAHLAINAAALTAAWVVR